MGKLETFRSRASENPESQLDKDLIANQCVKIEELEQELLKNKEKIRMNSQLTQALSDSVKREQQLKDQCDQLLENLQAALAEGENLAKRVSTLEGSKGTTQMLVKKNSELCKLIESDLDKGGEKWKQLKYSRIEGLSDKENFELLRKVVDFRDQYSEYNKELNVADLDSFKQSTDFRSMNEALHERETDIKDLLRDYEKLQNSYKELDRIYKSREDELINLREKLAEKSNQLVSVYENSEINKEIPEELNMLKNEFFSLAGQNQELSAQLSVIKKSGKDFFHALKEMSAETIDRSSFIVRAEEAFKWRLALEVQSLESNLVESMKDTLFTCNQQIWQLKILEKSLESELNMMKHLSEEEKKAELNAKNNKNDWKKFRREHVQRIEKIYENEINALKEQISGFCKNFQGSDKKLGKMTEKLQNEIKELTLALKKEHEGKKMLADLFAKEKESCEKFKESSEKAKSDIESLQKRYIDAKSALEDSNKKIFAFEQNLSKTSEIENSIIEKENIYRDKIEELEVTKTKLYAEITRLNKQIQEVEIDKQRLDIETKSNFYFTQESKESLFAEIRNREEKISSLEKENFQLKNEIFELDVRLKSSELDMEKIQTMKKTISDLQKQVLSVEMLSREKEYLSEENQVLREDLKNSQMTVQQLKTDLRSISTEIVEIQSELTKTQNLKNLSSKSLQDENNLLKSQQDSLQSELETLKSDLFRTLEENSLLKKVKKSVESENLTLKSKLQNIHKEIPAEFVSVKEKVQELEMKYESLEACQDEMINKLRKMYRNWCNQKKMTPLRLLSQTDPMQEALAIAEHLMSDGKKSTESDQWQELIEKTKYLLGKVESQPDSTLKSHTLRLIAENIELKQEMLSKHEKSVKDENIFQELSSIPGVNEWTLQKWKESEKDVSRLRRQLLDMTVELEKLIKNFNKPQKSEEIEYMQSETEFLRQRIVDLEEQILKLNNEKIETKQDHLKVDKDKEALKSCFFEIFHALTGKYPENESVSANMAVLVPYLDSYKEAIYNKNILNQEFSRIEEYEKSLKYREKLLDHRSVEKSNQDNQGLVSALYEEKKLREELEEELTEKCNMVENLLREFEENKKNMKL